MLMAVGLLISGHAGAEQTLVATMTALEQTMSFYMDENADEPNHIYASADAALRVALDSLPKNSTPAKVTLFADVTLGFNVTYLTIKQYQDVTIDLNNHTIRTSTEAQSATQVVLNRGTLTIEDNSQDKNGKITNAALKPDMSKIPGKGDYLIYNEGTFILNSGTLESTSEGSATYAVENHINGNRVSPTFIMNGGKLVHEHASAVRMYLNGTMYERETCSVIINDGEIEAAGYGVIVHYSTSSSIAPHVIFSMNGGRISSTGAHYAYSGMATSGTGNDMSNTYITINGGTIDGSIMVNANSGVTRKGKENLSITGGTFLYQPAVDTRYAAVTFEEFITGGIFRNFSTEMKRASSYEAYDYCGIYESYRDYTDEQRLEKWPKDKYEWVYGTGKNDGFLFFYPLENAYLKFKDNIDNLIADGYAAIDTTGVDETDGNDLVIASTKKVNIEVNGGEIKLSEQSIVLDKVTDLTITPISDGNTTINIDEDTEVNKIKVIAPDDKGEAQIVVKDGYTLNVGNGGLVSENNDLVFVKVEAGGKLTVGNNGVDQQGEQYPIIVENNGEKSGVYMVSPDATDSRITEPEATVRLYTRAYMTATTNRWEQFACPVKEVKYMKPMGAAANNDAFGTEVYEWDYATDAWYRINTSRKEGWTTGINLVPFKAYDLINNSLPSEGGITYEFRGKLVGNKDMDLIFPEHGFCVFGNSYTAPIDLTVLFGKIQNDIEADNIDPCVYIYDSKSDRFASVNALDLYLHGIGAADVDFTQIPPQQAFVMNLIIGNSGATSVDYRNAVWGNTQNVNIPIMAPQRHDISEFGTIASIKVSDATSQDKMLLVESDKYAATYDRGADAEKYMDGQHFNLYASTEAGNLCNIATNDLEGTILTFQAGEALEYELSIGNMIGSDYAIKDLLTNTMINMNEGNTYSFTAQPNSTMDRFQVVKVHTMATDLQKAKATASAKGIYTILGHYLGETSMWHSLPAGVYVVNGVKMAK